MLGVCAERNWEKIENYHTYIACKKRDISDFCLSNWCWDKPEDHLDNFAISMPSCQLFNRLTFIQTLYFFYRSQLSPFAPERMGLDSFQMFIALFFVHKLIFLIEIYNREIVRKIFYTRAYLKSVHCDCFT